MTESSVAEKRSSMSLRAKLAAVIMSITLMYPMAAGLFATDHEARSTWEQRSLHELPTWTGTLGATEYFSQLSSYFDDHVGAALAINSIYRKILFYVFRDDLVTDVTHGLNGFSYLNTHDRDDPLAIFTTTCIQGVQTENVQLLESRIQRIATHFEQRGIRVSMAIAPTKPVLYPENLPSRIPEYLRSACTAYGESSNIPSLLAASPLAREIPILYPFKEFRERKQSQYFYPKENFHWDGESAHMFAAMILSALDLPPGPEFDQGKHLIDTLSDLSMKGFQEEITVWDYPYKAYGIIKPQSERDKKRWENRFFPAPSFYHKYRSRNPIDPERRALLLSNSFGAGLAPHLAPGFSLLINLNINRLPLNAYQAVLVNYVDRMQFTDVIFVVEDHELILGFKFEHMDRFFTKRAR